MMDFPSIKSFLDNYKFRRGTAKKTYLLYTFFSINFLKFIFLGIFAYVFVSLQMYVYIQVLKISHPLGYAIAQVCLITFSFMFARHWIFNSTGEDMKIQALKFVLAVFSFRFLDWCLFLLFSVFFGIHYILSILLSMGIVYPFKYLAFKIKIFNDR